MDIRHCRVSSLPQVAEDGEASVVVAKHLCGAATDLAIRAVANSVFEAGERSPIVGLGIATCCHHACSWADYCGADWLKEIGFSGHEFEVIKYWTG